VRAVYKYPLPASTQPFYLTLPRGAEVVHVEAQPAGGDEVKLWALVETDNETERRAFVAASTGQALPTEWRLAHVKTFTVGAFFVFHLFEVLP
jgi:hypothetical protein